MVQPSATDQVNQNRREQRFHRLRALLGPGTHRKIARKCGLDNGHVSRILGGKTPRPSSVALKKISDASGISIDDVFWYIRVMQRLRAIPEIREAEEKGE